MKHWEQRSMEVSKQYAYLLYEDLRTGRKSSIDFDRARQLLPARLLVQAALKQGRAYKVKRARRSG